MPAFAVELLDPRSLYRTLSSIKADTPAKKVVDGHKYAVNKFKKRLALACKYAARSRLTYDGGRFCG